MPVFNDKRWTGDGVRIGSEPARQAANETGLASAKVAFQRDHCSRRNAHRER